MVYSVYLLPTKIEYYLALMKFNFSRKTNLSSKKCLNKTTFVEFFKILVPAPLCPSIAVISPE